MGHVIRKAKEIEEKKNRKKYYGFQGLFVITIHIVMREKLNYLEELNIDYYYW